jgi:hypothetical protein
LLAFYPKDFRAEFELEMTAVFSQALNGQRSATARLLWRELRDWPGVVWSTHHAERREIMMSTSSTLEQPDPSHQLVPASSWRSAWLAALGYLVYLWIAAAEAILIALSEPLHLTWVMQSRIVGYAAGVILAVDLIVVLLCWRRGWPRWSLPYLGVVLTWLVLVFQSLIKNDGSLLIFTAPLVALVIIGLAVLGSRWKGLHSFYERLHRDWTLFGLAYLSYTPWVFILMGDETPYQTTGTLLSTALLALGVLVYMRCTELWQRVLVLPVAFTAAYLVILCYLWVYYQPWHSYYTSSSFRLLANWGVVGIMPVLVFGLLELGRYAFHRWLHAA